MKVSPLGGLFSEMLVMYFPRVEESESVPVPTLRLASSENASVPKSKFAAAPPLVALIPPPFSFSASAAMLIPSLSTSPPRTLYSNTSVSEPVPVVSGTNVAMQPPPGHVAIPSSTCGVPVTSTESLNTTVTRILSVG